MNDDFFFTDLILLNWFHHLLYCYCDS